MRIDCIHGYFKFTETKSGQVSDFINRYGSGIESAGDYFTFSELLEAPTYSLPGGSFLGCPTTVLFEGHPWEVMRANELVYDFTKGQVVPVSSILNALSLSSAGNMYIATGMILPGSIMDDGTRVTDYAAFFESDRFKYSEVSGG